jgi:hypothetical protein
MAPADGDMTVERAFVGAGCNRVVNNVSWSPSGLVAFGAQNSVAIFCPQVPFLILFYMKDFDLIP